MRFDEQALLQRLQSLAPILRVAFAAACAERLLPAYSVFHAKTGRGNPVALYAILSDLWEGLTAGETADSQLAATLDHCMGLIPREDEGEWINEQAYAEDAAAAVAYAVRARKDGDAQEAVWAARRAYEAVDHFVINRFGISPEDPGGEEHIADHPVVQEELRRQDRDLSELESLTVPDRFEPTTRSIRLRAQDEAGGFFAAP